MGGDDYALPLDYLNAVRLIPSMERAETLAETGSYGQAGWSTEGRNTACDIDNAYTICLTPRISVVPMVRRVEAAFAA